MMVIPEEALPSHERAKRPHFEDTARQVTAGTWEPPELNRGVFGSSELATNMKARKDVQRLETAHHEAGHAVAAFLVKRRFRHVSIEPDQRSLGHVLYRAWDKRFDPNARFSPRTEILLRDAVVTALAGFEAQFRFSGKRPWRSARSDHDQALDLALRACCSGEEAAAYVEWLSVRTRQMFSVPSTWKAVRALARSLLRQQRLSYKEAHKIYLEATGQALEPWPDDVAEEGPIAGGSRGSRWRRTD
jgi:hypothetical protein